jgi:hypothetical protein
MAWPTISFGEASLILLCLSASAYCLTFTVKAWLGK